MNKTITIGNQTFESNKITHTTKYQIGLDILPVYKTIPTKDIAKNIFSKALYTIGGTETYVPVKNQYSICMLADKIHSQTMDNEVMNKTYRKYYYDSNGELKDTWVGLEKRDIRKIYVNAINIDYIIGNHYHTYTFVEIPKDYNIIKISLDEYSLFYLPSEFCWCNDNLVEVLEKITNCK